MAEGDALQVLMMVRAHRITSEIEYEFAYDDYIERMKKDGRDDFLIPPPMWKRHTPVRGKPDA